VEKPEEPERKRRRPINKRFLTIAKELGVYEIPTPDGFTYADFSLWPRVPEKPSETEGSEKLIVKEPDEEEDKPRRRRISRRRSTLAEDLGIYKIPNPSPDGFTYADFSLWTRVTEKPRETENLEDLILEDNQELGSYYNELGIYKVPSGYKYAKYCMWPRDEEPIPEIDVKTVAEMMEAHVSTVHNWMKQGKVRFRKEKGKILIPVQDIYERKWKFKPYVTKKVLMSWQSAPMSDEEFRNKMLRSYQKKRGSRVRLKESLMEMRLTPEESPPEEIMEPLEEHISEVPPKEAALALNITLRTVHNYIKQGKLKHRKKKNRIFIPVSEIERLKNEKLQKKAKSSIDFPESTKILTPEIAPFQFDPMQHVILERREYEDLLVKLGHLEQEISSMKKLWSIIKDF
jgi:DNA-directed RNA polymerase specialized sigma24 family protein